MFKAFFLKPGDDGVPVPVICRMRRDQFCNVIQLEGEARRSDA